MILVPNTVYRSKREIASLLKKLPGSWDLAMSTVLDTPAKSGVLNGLKGIFVRFDEIKVLDNHTWCGGADVYPIIMVMSDASDTPYQFTFTSVFNDVHDGDCLSIGHQLDMARIQSKMPSFLDIHVLLMKSNESTRDIGQRINDALATDTGKTLVDTISKVVSGSNPVAGTIVSIGTSLLSLITGYMSKEKDEQIYYGVTSFEDDPDELGIGKQWPLTDKKNASVLFEVIGKTK